MIKCKSNSQSCCCNIDGKCKYWGSCDEQVLEKVSKNMKFIEYISSKGEKDD